MFITATLLIGMFGTASLSAAAIANQLSAIAFMIPIAMATAGTIRVGNYAGAQDRTNLFRSASATMIIAIVATLGTTLVLLIWPETLVGLFLDNDDPLFADVILVAMPLMLLTALYQIPDGIQAVIGGRYVYHTKIIAVAVIDIIQKSRMCFAPGLPPVVAAKYFWPHNRGVK